MDSIDSVWSEWKEEKDTKKFGLGTKQYWFYFLLFHFRSGAFKESREFYYLSEFKEFTKSWTNYIKHSEQKIANNT